MFRCAAILASFLSVAVSLLAVEVPCGLSSMVETSAPTYLPLARAARIEGVVVLIADFGTDGTVAKLSVVSGPAMLQTAAVDFVKGWRANRYTGPRTCPLVVSYLLGNGDKTTGQRSDVQHYIVFGAAPPCLCDPPAELRRKRRRFLFF
jgi:TonB family protein